MRKSLIHGIAECHDCSYHCEEYLKVEKSARNHAAKTGHEVIVELGYTMTYNERVTCQHSGGKSKTSGGQFQRTQIDYNGGR